jgi:Methyltransferase domain
MKHMTLLFAHGMRRMPATMAELGPGDSLGVGLAAMLSGVDHYQALDVVPFASTEVNLQIFEELVGLFRSRAPRPSKGWPDFDDLLDDRLFPSSILTEERLAEALRPSRLRHIREALTNSSNRANGVSVCYKVPWNDPAVIEPHSVDLIVSHSVLEHVTDLDSTYRAMQAWLKPGGLMSHQIDFESHGLTTEWNGYRAIPEFVWTLMMGKRKFLINRAPYSEHAEKFTLLNLRPLSEMKCIRSDGIGRERCARRWKSLDNEDWHCSGALIQLIAS